MYNMYITINMKNTTCILTAINVTDIYMILGKFKASLQFDIFGTSNVNLVGIQRQKRSFCPVRHRLTLSGYRVIRTRSFRYVIQYNIVVIQRHQCLLFPVRHSITCRDTTSFEFDLLERHNYVLNLVSIQLQKRSSGTSQVNVVRIQRHKCSFFRHVIVNQSPTQCSPLTCRIDLRQFLTVIQDSCKTHLRSRLFFLTATFSMFVFICSCDSKFNIII